MPDIIMYSTRICPYCVRAEQLLSKKGVSVQKILVDQDPEQMRIMMQRTGRRTVPQIYIGERHVGGYDDLVELDLEGKLDAFLAAD